MYISKNFVKIFRLHPFLCCGLQRPLSGDYIDDRVEITPCRDCIIDYFDVHVRVRHAWTRIDFCWNQAELLILDVWSKTIEAGRRVQGSRDEFSYPQASGAFPSNFSPSLLRSPQKSLVVPSKPIVTQVTEHTRHGQVQFSLPLHSFDWIWRWHSLNFINKHWYVSNFCYRFNF